jgi:hypothetical protein
MINTYAMTALISASMAFAGGWSINNWRCESAQKQTIEAAADQERELHTLEQKRSNGVIAAQNVARKRETALRRDADSARNALDSLRSQSDAALSRARTSHEACTVTANAQAVVLDQCGSELTTLARIADGHASDAQTLMDAWPKLKFETQLQPKD